MKKYMLVSLGEAVVEIFRKEADKPMDSAADFVGPYPSGAPAITADTIARLGAPAAFVGTVGKDAFAECVRGKLKRDGVDISALVGVDRVMTGIAFTSYYSDGSREFIYNFTTAAPAEFCEAHIDEAFIGECEWLHISANVMAFSESARAAVIKAAKAAKARGTRISVDPNIRLEIMDKEHIYDLMGPVLELADIVIPSEGELELIYNGRLSEAEAITDLLSKNAEYVILKQGERGCTFYWKDGELSVPAYEGVEVADATGCGDSFSAGVVYGLMQGWSVYKTARFANAVGAITATKKGAMEGAESLDEVYAFIKARLGEEEFKKLFG